MQLFLLTADVAFNNSLGICGLIETLLVSVVGDAGETISGVADCCFGMFDLSGLVIV